LAVTGLRGPAKVFTFAAMSTVAEIEAAIERLPLTEVEKVAEWEQPGRARPPLK